MLMDVWQGEEIEEKVVWGKNAIMLFLLFSCSVVSDSLQPHGLQPSRLLCPWEAPGKNTGAGCYFLTNGFYLQIFLEKVIMSQYL